MDNVTRALPAALQAQTYVLLFGGARGRYLDYGNLQPVTIGSAAGLLEPSLLAGTVQGAVFIDLHAGTLPGEADPAAWL